MAPLPAGGVYVDRVATIKHHGYRPAPGPGTGEQQVRLAVLRAIIPFFLGKNGMQAMAGSL